MNKMQAWNGIFGLSNVTGIVSPDYTVFRPISNLSLEYFQYLFRSRLYAGIFFKQCRGMGTAFLRLNSTDFGDTLVPWMERKEQKQIAAFLDYETAKIDALIEKQQQLIALLGEKRQAVISHAVTKGLNPDVPMRDSGVEWLGEVPEHWVVLQLRRFISDMEQGKSPECENRNGEIGEWAVLKTSCVNGGYYNDSANKALPQHLTPVESYEVKVGDVLMSRASGSTDLIGAVAYVQSTREKNLLSDKIYRIRFEADVEGMFFRYLMASSYMREMIVRSISGAAGMANNITKTSILSFQAALPPLKEQRAIVKHIEETVSRMEWLVAKAEDALLLLQERRTALISAAVTGKIDVRNWKPPTGHKPQKPNKEAA
jgi:type I restriction enzyme S subunit